MTSIPYRSEVDGLRAIAVIPVLLFHLGIPFCDGGFLGVDVFFVLSGYLITTIIFRDLSHGTFEFKKFWIRRIRRLVPSLLVVTAAILMFISFYQMPLERVASGKQSLSALLSSSNYYYWMTAGDYWGSAAESSLFLHTWSLSVEEQFYVLFPIFLYILHRCWPNALHKAVGFIGICSFAAFCWGLARDTDAAFFFMPTRIWELTSGGMLAFISNKVRKDHWINQTLSFVGLTILLFAYLATVRLGIGNILAVAGTCLVLTFGQFGFAKKLLSQKPLVHLGKLSYCIYLWHWPVVVLSSPLGINWDGPTDKIALLILIYGVSILTSEFIETPFRYGQIKLRYIVIFWSIAVSFSFLISKSPLMLSTEGFVAIEQYYYDVFPPKSITTDILRNRGDATFHQHPNYVENCWQNGGIQINCVDRTPNVLVLGDSHAEMWGPVIESATTDLRLPVSFMCIAGVPPFFNPEAIDKTSINPRNDFSDLQQRSFNSARKYAITEWKPTVVIISERWGYWDEATMPLLNFLRDIGSEVLLIEDPPQLRCGDVNVLQKLIWNGLQAKNSSTVIEPCFDLSAHQGGRKLVRDICSRYANVNYLPTWDLYMRNGGALALIDKKPIYRDDDHLTIHGAMLIKKRLKETLRIYFQ